MSIPFEKAEAILNSAGDELQRKFGEEWSFTLIAHNPSNEDCIVTHMLADKKQLPSYLRDVAKYLEKGR